MPTFQRHMFCSQQLLTRCQGAPPVHMLTLVPVLQAQSHVEALFKDRGRSWKARLCGAPDRDSCAVGLLQGLEARVQRPEYAQVLADCQQMYCEIRLQLVAGVAQARFQSYAKEPLPTLTRNGWSTLMQVRQAN